MAHVAATRRSKEFSVESNNFQVAAVVSAVFKAVAIITLLVGAYILVYVRNHYLNSWREQLSIGGGTVFLAAVLAFFGYVLDMLRATLLETRRQGLT